MRSAVGLAEAALLAVATFCLVCTGCDDTGVGPTPGGCACPKAVNKTVRLPLACLCGGEAQGCPATIVDFDTDADCAHGEVVVERTGCGMISRGSAAISSGRAATFDASSGALTGVYQWSSVPTGPCAVTGAYSYVYGDVLSSAAGACAKVRSCSICGTALDGTKPCGQ